MLRIFCPLLTITVFLYTYSYADHLMRLVPIMEKAEAHFYKDGWESRYSIAQAQIYYHIRPQHEGQFSVLSIFIMRVCDDCGTAQNSGYVHWLRIHSKSVSSRRIVASFKGKLREHRRAAELQNCDNCEYQSQQKVHLASHIATRHPSILNSEIFTVRCESCYRAFAKKNLFKHYLATHASSSSAGALLQVKNEQQKCFKCDDCCPSVKKFTWRFHLTRHMAKHFPLQWQAPDKPRAICDECQASRVKFTLQEHLQKLHGFDFNPNY